MDKVSIKDKFIYRVILWALLVSSVVLLIYLAPTLYKPEYFPSDDFVQFWAGARLNFQGENPYDPQNVERLQIAAGGVASGTYTISIMLNPPWAISLVKPIGLLNYPVSRVIWLILSILLILISTLALWRVYEGNPNQRWLGLLAAFIFAPTISVLEVGQISSLVLLGITGFLFFTIYQRNDWLAGASLAIASIKPQIAFLFWIALLFWIIQQRRWKILLSSALIVLGLTLIAFVFNPHIIQQYLNALQSYQMLEWANPTLGSYLRYFIFGLDNQWLQIIPTIIGVIWLIFYWHKHSHRWNWKDELPVLLLINLIITPYVWTYDFAILMPAIIASTILILSTRKKLSAIILTIVFIAANILDLVLHARLSDFWFIWLAPVLLICFLFARRLSSNTANHEMLHAT